MCVICIGNATNGDSVKRTRYITQINCRVPGKTFIISKIIRFIHRNCSYYGAITDDGFISWFGVSGSGSLIKRYPLIVTPGYTNIFCFLKEEYVRVRINPLNEENSIYSKQDTSASTSITLASTSITLASTPSTPPNTPSACVCVFNGHAFIEHSERVYMYDISGVPITSIETGIEKIESMDSSSCGQYLLIFGGKGTVNVFDIHKKKSLYKKKYSPGGFYFFGDIFRYSRYLIVCKSSVFIVRAYDGNILLELTYSEDISCSVLDVLQTRIISGSHSGKIYQTRIDGEKECFSESKISDNRISSLFFSLCGTLIHAVSGDTLFSVSLRDGKVVQRMSLCSDKHIFTYSTSSNLHLQ